MVHTVVRRGLFQVKPFDMNESVAEHVHGSLALLQHDVADQRFEVTVFRFHVDKNHLAEDGLETFNLDTHRIFFSRSNGFSILTEVAILPMSIFVVRAISVA